MSAMTFPGPVVGSSAAGFCVWPTWPERTREMHAQPNTVKPNHWFTRLLWCGLFPEETETVHLLRMRLYQLGIYPTMPIAPDDPAHWQQMTNTRAILDKVIPLLAPNDLIALGRVARLFYLVSVQPALFEYIAWHESTIAPELP